MALLPSAIYRGISVNSKSLKTRGEAGNGSTSKYIDIMCMDKVGFDGFNLIGRQINEAITMGNASRAQSVRRVLARWRYFWGNLPKNILSNEQIIGLFDSVNPMFSPFYKSCRFDFNGEPRELKIMSTSFWPTPALKYIF